MPTEPVGAYSAVRTILLENIDLDTDAVMARARELGASKPDATLRRIVNKTRSDLRHGRTKKTPAKAAKVTAPVSAYTLAREALVDDPDISSNDLVTRLKSLGVTKKDADIREVIYNVRRKLQAKAVAKPIPVPSAATVTAPPVVAVAPAEVVVAIDPFAAVRMANRTAAACGGIAKAREIAEAIRAVGGIDAFLDRLALVADILNSDTKL